MVLPLSQRSRVEKPGCVDISAKIIVSVPPPHLHHPCPALSPWRAMAADYPVILFYKYVAIVDPHTFAASQRALCTELGLKGRVLIAEEGINGTLAGPREAVDQYVATLRADERFADIEMKVSQGDAETFPKLVIKVRPEIVTLGAGPLAPDLHNHLSPED